jgi:peptidoglycan/xylan/chitin deacetylase (PgdA/CDA1 family)
MRALSLKAVEDELGIHSTWFLPSEEYHIPRHVARDLAKGSTIGSHDVKHDGRLIHIQAREVLLERLVSSRLKLEEVFEKEVISFRSPLLQFSEKIVSGLGQSGYRFDFSLPCWEPVHPVAMTGFGIEAVQSFQIHGVVEFPLTLFQDHQVFTVLGMNTREAVRFWVEQAKIVRQFDGDIVVLVHPDYSFSADIEGYRMLLNSLLEVHREAAQSGN